MKSLSHIRITKTERGYVLRERVVNLLTILPIALLMIGVGVYELYRFANGQGGGHMLEYICVPLLLGMGCFLIASVGRKLVLDEFGIRGYVWGIPTRCISWAQVKGFGVKEQISNGRYGKTTSYYIYFTSVRGKTFGRHCLRMEISKKDFREFRGSPLRAYVKWRRGNSTNDE